MLQYDSLRAFTDHLEATAKPFPIKVMGQSRPKVNYMATMLAAIYQDTPDPDTTPTPITTSFGTIHRIGAVLTGKDTYSAQIVAASDGSNSFQGDIFQTKIDLSAWGCKTICDYGIIVSHSCDIVPAPVVHICPVFPESQISQGLFEFIKKKPSPNYKVELQDILRNQQHRLMGLPPHEEEDHPLADDQLLVPLSLIMPVTRDKIGPTVLRLSYRANAFFQLRLATLFMRDVQRSDETRDF